MLSFCREDRLARMFFIGGRGRSADWEKNVRRVIALHRHSHDLLVGADYLVAHLQKHLERQLSALRGEDGGVDLLSLPAQEPLDRGGRVFPEGFHVLYRARKHVLEGSASGGFAGGPDGFGQRYSTDACDG